MLRMLYSMNLLGSDVIDKLTNEDAEAVVSAKTKKRKRSKHKKQRTSEVA